MMKDYTPDFTVAVQGVKGFCPAGEAYAKRNISEGKIPVLSCEGPCIRGEIARLAARYVQSPPTLSAREGAGNLKFHERALDEPDRPRNVRMSAGSECTSNSKGRTRPGSFGFAFC
jgi:hypothetical protein